LSFFDLDALDINFEEKEDIVKSAYNNDLEAFIILAEEHGPSPPSERLHYYASVAVMNRSLSSEAFMRIDENRTQFRVAVQSSCRQGLGRPCDHWVVGEAVKSGNIPPFPPLA